MYLFILISYLLFGSQDNFENRVNEYLVLKLPDFKKIDFQITSSPRLLKNDELIVDDDREFKLSGNTGYIPVIVNSKNGKLKSVLTVKLKLFGEASLACKTIHRGETILSDDFKSQTMDLSLVRGDIITAISDMQNYKAKKEIKEGTILTKDFLEALPIIRQGDKVIGFVEAGNVRINTDVIAKEDGIENEIIRVSDSSKKIFKAKIIDSYSVKIIE